MKKIMVAVFALSVASPAFAALGIDVGSTWYKIAYNYDVDDHLMGQGQSLLVSWTIDNDITLGAYNEACMVTDQDGSAYSFDMRAIQVSKGIVKNVSVGLNFGVMYNEWDGDNGTVTDVFGTVTILSGSSDKVAGTIKTSIGGRFYTDDGDYTFDGMIVNVAIGLGF